jgi:chemotaxis methyl-accepting protein methylase
MDAGALWQRLRQSFREWTGMQLPESYRPTALDVLGDLCTIANNTPPADYLRRLAVDVAERQRLLDGLHLGTTWFLRDASGLHALVDAVVAMPSVQAQGTVRVWSAGCSTGEEPYTLAMAILDRGLSPEILATDLNRASLRIGEAACYRTRATARVGEAWASRYFEPASGATVRVRASVRRCVTWGLHNLARSAAAPPPGWASFDAVACRNVLMFFGRDHALAVLRSLAAACRPDGYVLLGGIEQPLLWMLDVARARPELGLVSVAEIVDRPTSTTSAPAAATPARAVPARASAGPPAVATPALTSSSPPAALPGSPSVAELLTTAERLGRAGDADTALRCIERAVAKEPLSAPAQLALGLARKRLGRVADAIAALRAARFLDRDAWLAPYQLGLCLERTGEREDALDAFRGALIAIENGGGPGLAQLDEEIDALVRTTHAACRERIRALGQTE